MKVYVTDEKELIMEPSFKWAGNPNIIVAVKAFGLKATVQVFVSVKVDYEKEICMRKNERMYTHSIFLSLRTDICAYV